MSITDDQITLSGQLRYQYFDKPGFATISDNNHFAEYDETYLPYLQKYFKIDELPWPTKIIYELRKKRWYNF